METISVAIIFFILGTIFGILLHKFLLTKVPLNFNNDSRINWLIILVSVIWAISVIFDIMSPDYETPVLIHGIMGAIVGFFFWRPSDRIK